MDNQLIKKRMEYHKKWQINYSHLKILQEFIEKHANKFSSENAKQAIQDIKDYVEKLKKENDVLKSQCKELHQQFLQSCKHEILKKEYYDDCRCMLCQGFMSGKNINFEHFLLENCDEEYSYKIDDIIEKIIEQDEDIMEVFENYVRKENMPRIKIYRRIPR